MVVVCFSLKKRCFVIEIRGRIEAQFKLSNKVIPLFQLVSGMLPLKSLASRANYVESRNGDPLIIRDLVKHEIVIDLKQPQHNILTEEERNLHLR